MNANEAIKEWAEESGCKNISVHEDGIVFDYKGYTLSAGSSGIDVDRDSFIKRTAYRINIYVAEKKFIEEFGRWPDNEERKLLTQEVTHAL